MPKKQARIPKGGGTPRNPKRNRNSKKKGQNPDSKTRKYARMLADPCNAPLVGGIYGGNTTIRRETVNYPVKLQKEGYLVVFPEFCSDHRLANPKGYFLSNDGDIVEENQNWDSIFYSTNLTGSAPTSFTNIPTNLSDSNNSARFWYRPPDSYESREGGGGDSETRCISACLKITYAGTADTREGLFAPIRDVTPSETLGIHTDQESGAEAYRSVNEIIRHANVVVPTQPSLEVKWRGSGPGETDGWHTPHDGVFGQRYVKDAGGQSMGLTKEAEGDPSIRGMGFAWSGAADTDYIISYTKIYEVRPAREATHRNLAAVNRLKTINDGSPSYYEKARVMLNRWNPDWDLVQSFLWKSAQAYSKFSSGRTYLLKNEL